MYELTDWLPEESFVKGRHEALARGLHELRYLAYSIQEDPSQWPSMPQGVKALMQRFIDIPVEALNAASLGTRLTFAPGYTPPADFVAPPHLPVRRRQRAAVPGAGNPRGRGHVAHQLVDDDHVDDPDDISYPRKVKEDSRTANSEPVENVLPAVPLGTRDKSRNATTFLKSGDLNDIHATTDGESSKEMNISEKKRTQMSSCSANDSPSTDFDDNCVKKNRHSSPAIPILLSCQADRELYSRTKSFGLSNSTGSSKNPVTSSDDRELHSRTVHRVCSFWKELCIMIPLPFCNGFIHPTKD
ncbi:hypothetical protein K7X08_036279 [Anisodus acutangulus]|uniref:Uncharacterized protein n=1 Tax=Anisodus acutangulus TaxID=402998 RepID=A0A9Q1L627_9SOLA|nr:hypothetical protein K7X08_036279 [Anisodus acutangulus]